jgi:hypothetical protein
VVNELALTGLLNINKEYDVNEDHDLIMKHEQQLNGSAGIATRIGEVEIWKNNYLQKEREDTCFGCGALIKHIEDEKKDKEANVEMTKAKVSSKALILVALISAIPGILNLFINYFKK